MGPCTAGGAYIPSMADEAVIVQDVGSLYIAGPPLVKAATGVQLTSEELGGAKVHSTISGCTDHYASTEEEAMEMTRGIIASLNLAPQQRRVSPVEEPLYEGGEEEFSQLIPPDRHDNLPMMEVGPSCVLQLHSLSLSHSHTHTHTHSLLLQIIARLVDGSRLRQFKEVFGTTLCTGFSRING